MIIHVFVYPADGRSLFEQPKKVGGQYLFVDKGRIVVVALPLGDSGETTLVVSADEQVDPNECILKVPVAKGGL